MKNISLFVVLLLFSFGYARGQKYEISDSSGFKELVRWEGKDSIVDFNKDEILKKSEVYRQMLFHLQ